MWEPYSSGHEDWCSGRLEAVQGRLPLRLRAVAMDTGAGVALGIEEVIQCVTALLGLHKDEGERVCGCVGVRLGDTINFSEQY